MDTKETIAQDIVKFRRLMREKNIVVDSAYFGRYFDLKKSRAEIMSFSEYTQLSSFYHNPGLERTVDKQEFLLDVQFLRRILPKTYGGYKIFQSRGLSWETFFSRWERSLSRMPSTIPIKDALEEFDKMSSKFIDNHLQFPFVTKRTKTSSCTLAGKASGRTFMRFPRTVFDENELGVQKISFGPVNACSETEIKKLLSRQDHDLYIRQFASSDDLKFQEESEYSYLRIPTMSANVRGEIAKLKGKKVNLKTPLIVDLRSNRGFGNYELVGALNKLAGVSGTVDYFDYFETKVKNNKYVDAIADNFDLFFTLLYKTDGQKLDLRPVIKSNLSVKSKKNKVHKKINNKRSVVVLINRFVSSDGEALVNYLRHFKDHTIIGENTSGSCEFVEPGLLVLPNSKLPLMVPRGVNKLKIDGIRSVDGFGLSPDIYIFGKAWKKDSILSCIKQLKPKVT